MGLVQRIILKHVGQHVIVTLLLPMVRLAVTKVELSGIKFAVTKVLSQCKKNKMTRRLSSCVVINYMIYIIIQCQTENGDGTVPGRKFIHAFIVYRSHDRTLLRLPPEVLLKKKSRTSTCRTIICLTVLRLGIEFFPYTFPFKKIDVDSGIRHFEYRLSVVRLRWILIFCYSTPQVRKLLVTYI